MIVKTYHFGNAVVHIDDSRIEPNKPLPSFIRRKTDEQKQICRGTEKGDSSEQS